MTGDALYDDVVWRYVAKFMGETAREINHMKSMIHISAEAIRSHAKKHKKCDDQCHVMQSIRNENGEYTIMERMASESVVVRMRAMQVEGYDVGVPFGRLYDMHPGWESTIRSSMGL